MPGFSRARLVTLAIVLIGLAGSGAWLSVASAARIPRTPASAGNAYQDTLPYGFVHEQEGSGVDLHKVISTAQTPGQSATIRNISNETIVGLRFVAAVERLTWPRPAVRLFVSDVIPVSVAPGQSVEVAPHFPTVAQLQKIAAEWGGSRLQLFFGVQSVRFANGSEWSMTPNPLARSGSNALAVTRVRPPAIPRLAYSRDLIVRDANRPQVSFGACRDERNRATSHGGTVPMLNERGRFVKCENGRWVEAAGRWPRW